MLIVATNVLVDVLQDDPDWAEWSIGQLRAQAQVHAHLAQARGLHQGDGAERNEAHATPEVRAPHRGA